MINKMFNNLYNLKHGRYLSRGVYRVPEYPRIIHAELTNSCNFECCYCPRSQALERSVGFMEEGIFRKIVDEGVKSGLYQLHLCMFGEPLLHPQAVSFVRYAKAAGVAKVGVGSNGSLLTKELSAQLIDAGIDILHICLDGARKETYEKLRRGGNYDLVVKNLENLIMLIKTKNLRKPHIYLNIIESENTKGQLKEFVKKWDKALQGTSHSKDYIKRYTTFARQVSSKNAAPELTFYNFRMPCFRLKNEIGIFWNGDVTACCYDAGGRLKVGSLRENTLKEIWHSNALTGLRNLHARDNWEKLGLCRGCEATNYPLTLSKMGRKIATFFR